MPTQDCVGPNTVFAVCLRAHSNFYQQGMFDYEREMNSDLPVADQEGKRNAEKEERAAEHHLVLSVVYQQGQYNTQQEE